LLPFEFLAVFFAYKLVRLQYSSNKPAWLVAFAVTLAPTVIADGALWGQCDIIYASMLLGTLYFSIVGKQAAMVALFGVALAFKAQAVFLAPFLLMLAMRSELPLKRLLYAPLVYIMMLIPAVLLGRSLVEVLTVYVRQGRLFNQLSMNAPNLYYFIPNEYYLPFVLFGISVTVFAAAALAALPWWRRTNLTASAQVQAATMFVALAPFLLPKMHDRYFFAADLFSIILAFFIPRLWLVAVLFQASSIMAYVPLISSSRTWPWGEMITFWMPVAALLNTILVGFLIVLYWRTCTLPTADVKGPTRQFDLVVAAFCTTFAVWSLAASLLAYAKKALVFHSDVAHVWVAEILRRELPMNLAHGSYKHVMLFFVLFLFSYIVLKTVARRFGLLGGS
jgi:Gpi18-like mannosyltransferase